MKRMRSRHGLGVGKICICILWGLTTWAGGGILQPLYVGNLVPVLDEYGRPMKGSPLPQEAASRAWVEIRTATDGIIRPPATNGLAHPSNPLLMTDSVGGIGANAKTADAGLFCLLFPNRPAGGTMIFARVYDAPTVEQSAFYVDSGLAVVPTNGISLVLCFGKAQPLDPGDDDADGLDNSWERVLGTDDRPTADYDEDGMCDLDEMLAGTDPRDSSSLLAFQMAQPETGSAPGFDPLAKLMHVRWPAVPGKSYQLEYAPRLVPDPATGAAPAFFPLGAAMTAVEGASTMDTWVDISGPDGQRMFRVRLVETGSQ